MANAHRAVEHRADAGIRSRSGWKPFAAVGLLALMAVLAGGPALFLESPTFDEIAHMGAGLSYVNHFDARYNVEHPPLAKVLSGVSMAAGGIRADYRSPAWIDSDSPFAAFLGEWVFGDWVALHWNDPHKAVFWARIPMLLVTLLLGWCIYAVAARLGGEWAGLLCLAVYVSTPIFLTFGPLVLTDVPVALCSVFMIWTFADLWRNPSRAAFWKFVLSLTGGLLTKYSALVVLFALVSAALLTKWWPGPARAAGEPLEPQLRRTWRRTRWLATLRAIFTALFFFYVFTLVLSWNEPTSWLSRLGTSLPALAVRRMLVPLLHPVIGLWFILSPQRPPAFLLGHSYPHGTVLFFPVLFALKSAPGFLALLLALLIVSVWLRRRGPSVGIETPVLPREYAVHWRFWWMTLAIYSAVCLISHFDISIRHFTIPIALSIVLLAPLPRLVSRLGVFGPKLPAIGAIAVAALAASCLVTALMQYPWYMPYASFLAGGTPTYQLFSDSNLDWDQGLFAVQDFARTHRLQRLPLDFYGSSEPEAIVPQAVMWNCQRPEEVDAGHWAVVSANLIVDAENCAWLLHYPKQPLAGGSMYAFLLPARIPAAGQPDGPPPASQQKVLFGTKDFDFRQMTFPIYRDPTKLKPVLDAMTAKFQQPRKTGKN